MAPLFSKVDLNKLWHDVQNEETLICTKFRKDLFNISKVIGRKKWLSFFDWQCSLIAAAATAAGAWLCCDVAWRLCYVKRGYSPHLHYPFIARGSSPAGVVFHLHTQH